MKTSYQLFAASAALVVAVGAMFATPVSAKTMHHSKRTMRHHRMTRHHTMMHGSAMGSMGTMHHGSTMSKGSMDGGTTGTIGAGSANPAMSTAPATSGGDKP